MMVFFDRVKSRARAIMLPQQWSTEGLISTEAESQAEGYFFSRGQGQPRNISEVSYQLWQPFKNYYIWHIAWMTGLKTSISVSCKRSKWSFTYFNRLRCSSRINCFWSEQIVNISTNIIELTLDIFFSRIFSKNLWKIRIMKLGFLGLSLLNGTEYLFINLEFKEKDIYTLSGHFLVLEQTELFGVWSLLGPKTSFLTSIPP